jgi:hypothetical protein
MTLFFLMEQGKKFSNQRETHDGAVPENDLNLERQ